MKKLFFILFLLLAFSATQTINAQFFEKLKKKTEEKIKKEGEKRVEDKMNKGVVKGYDEAEKQLVGDKNDGKKSDDKSKDTDSKKNNESVTTGSDNSSKLLVASKYDFIPGEKVIFYDDFTAENIGDFPIQWNTTGSGEVVTTNVYDGRWFHITNSRGITTLDAPIVLPENYTIEYDVVPLKDVSNNNNTEFRFFILSTSRVKDLNYGLARPGEAAIVFTFGYSNGYFAYSQDGTPGQEGRETALRMLADKKYRVSIWVQKQRIRLYIGQEKLFDAPRAISMKYKYNMIRFDRGTPMISNLRIATGLPDMRSKLLTEGKLISYGIYFDVNKDIVKPESYPSIKEIAAILKDNPAVKIRIVGHTDSDGEDKSNLDLSKRRAASVKDALVKDFSIDMGRIEIDGKGESEPIAQNDSAVNKALNRRVEFIKI